MTTLQKLIDVQEITQVKYRYMRALDTHQWDLMRTCFTEDARAWYAGGKYSSDRGREGVIELLSGMMTDKVVSSHIAIHPEIDVTGETTAAGVWRFQDIVHVAEVGALLTGAGYYYDEYRKEPEGWRICSTGYERIFEARESEAAKAGFEFKPHPRLGMRVG